MSGFFSALRLLNGAMRGVGFMTPCIDRLYVFAKRAERNTAFHVRGMPMPCGVHVRTKRTHGGEKECLKNTVGICLLCGVKNGKSYPAGYNYITY